MKTVIAIALAALVGSACAATLDTPGTPTADVVVPDLGGADVAPAADPAAEPATDVGTEG